MQRRRFIRNIGCSSCLVLGGGVAISFLEGCASVKPYAVIDGKVKDYKIPLTSFETVPYLLIQRKTRESEEILVVKKGETEFLALIMRCTHKGVGLVPKGNIVVCPAHGSKFSLEGKVEEGPAKESLSIYDTRIEGSELIVMIRDIT